MECDNITANEKKYPKDSLFERYHHKSFGIMYNKDNSTRIYDVRIDNEQTYNKSYPLLKLRNINSGPKYWSVNVNNIIKLLPQVF